MGKIWVLDTDTKGTGAEMVPLEKVLQRKGPMSPKDAGASPARRARRTRPKPDLKPVEAPKPRQPRKFKVVDVMTRQALAEGAGIRETLNLLERTRSVVDVTVYVWEPGAERWRALAFGEQKALWGFRRQPAQ